MVGWGAKPAAMESSQRPRKSHQPSSPSPLCTRQLLVLSIQGQSGNWNFVFSWRACANDSFGCQGVYYLSEELTYLWADSSDLWLCSIPQFPSRTANRCRKALQAHYSTLHLHPSTKIQQVAHLRRHRGSEESEKWAYTTPGLDLKRWRWIRDPQCSQPNSKGSCSGAFPQIYLHICVCVHIYIYLWKSPTVCIHTHT